MILESSQRRSAALLFHCSGAQCAAGNCFSTALLRRTERDLVGVVGRVDAARIQENQPENGAHAVIFLPFPNWWPEAGFLVVVHHADRLHERVHRGRTDEAESRAAAVFGERVGAAPGKAPDVLGKTAEFLAHLDGTRARFRWASDLAWNAGRSPLGEQAAGVRGCAVTGDLFHVEARERAR
jgi:hypothetical protein